MYWSFCLAAKAVLFVDLDLFWEYDKGKYIKVNISNGIACFYLFCWLSQGSVMVSCCHSPVQGFIGSV